MDFPLSNLAWAAELAAVRAECDTAKNILIDYFNLATQEDVQGGLVPTLQRCLNVNQKNFVELNAERNRFNAIYAAGFAACKRAVESVKAPESLNWQDEGQQALERLIQATYKEVLSAVLAAIEKERG